MAKRCSLIFSGMAFSRMNGSPGIIFMRKKVADASTNSEAIMDRNFLDTYFSNAMDTSLHIKQDDSRLHYGLNDPKRKGYMRHPAYIPSFRCWNDDYFAS